MSEKKPEAKKPKLKPKAFGKGRFTFGEGMVHLAISLSRRKRIDVNVCKQKSY